MRTFLGILAVGWLKEEDREGVVEQEMANTGWRVISLSIFEWIRFCPHVQCPGLRRSGQR